MTLVPMLFRLLHNGSTIPLNLRLDPYEHPVHRFRALHDEAKVIEELRPRRLQRLHVGCGQLMQRQVVVPRTQIHVVRIRLPYHFHSEEAFVEGLRPSKVLHTQGKVA